MLIIFTLDKPEIVKIQADPHSVIVFGMKVTTRRTVFPGKIKKQIGL